jgi:hypothetical protein
MGRSLVAQHTISCGCARKASNAMKKRQLTGKSYGLWTVIKELGRTPNQQVKWLCECECGTQRIVNGLDLVSGKSKGCGCTRKHLFGEDSPGWKGGITPINKLIRVHIVKNTPWIRNVFERDHYTCQRCGGRGGRLRAHHRIKFSDIIAQFSIHSIEESYKCSLLTDPDNGICLCTECHQWVHSRNNQNRDFLISMVNAA